MMTSLLEKAFDICVLENWCDVAGLSNLGTPFHPLLPPTSCAGSATEAA